MYGCQIESDFLGIWVCYGNCYDHWHRTVWTAIWYAQQLWDRKWSFATCVTTLSRYTAVRYGGPWDGYTGKNRELKKMEIQFFPSNTCIIDQFWRILVTYRVTNFLPKLVHMLLFSTEKNEFPLLVFLYFRVMPHGIKVWRFPQCRVLKGTGSQSVVRCVSTYSGGLVSARHLEKGCSGARWNSLPMCTYVRVWVWVYGTLLVTRQCLQKHQWVLHSHLCHLGMKTWDRGRMSHLYLRWYVSAFCTWDGFGRGESFSKTARWVYPLRIYLCPTDQSDFGFGVWGF